MKSTSSGVMFFNYDDEGCWIFTSLMMLWKIATIEIPARVSSKTKAILWDCLLQADPRCHFGLGKAMKADTVEIR
jgi:hypothetical protein